MNALLEQFLSEAREGLESIGHSLMALEQSPDDAELIADLFRLVHTLKGNSGLFDFPEMTRVLHAGEDLMDAVRQGSVAYTATLADRLLDAMDFVGLLCDAAENNKPNAASVTNDSIKLSALLRGLIRPSHTQEADAPTSVDVTTQAKDPVTQGVLEALQVTLPTQQQLTRVPEITRILAFQQALSSGDLYWVHYTPAEECFFNGEDPLHQVRQTPGLLWGEITTRKPWPVLNELDAYSCQLDFKMLVVADHAELVEHYRYVPDRVSICPISVLLLIIPQGDPHGGPVYEDFVIDGLDFADSRYVPGLVRAVRALLSLSNYSLWVSSALRWLLVLLDAKSADWNAIRALILSFRSMEHPDWFSILSQAEILPQVSVLQKSDDFVSPFEQAAFNQLVEVQREVLSMPDDAQWLVGRIKAVTASLAACLRARMREDETPELMAIAKTAIEEKSSARLAQWLETAFPAETLRTTVNESAVAHELNTNITSSFQSVEAIDAETQDESDLRLGRRIDEPIATKSLKVDQTKIDRLMDLIGEMTVAKNAIPYLANRAEVQFGVRELSREIKVHYAVINRISEEMQDAIMQVRMMPVSFVFQRFPRLVRDLSRRLGKQVNLILEGEDTAADKNIIESIGDPLVHMVRNSLDHGVETPDVRRVAGKPEMATLKISARQDADRVVIEINDDGKGIDPVFIKRKAYEKGLIDELVIDQITDQDAINLIFLPGFSTAENISELSGRGVGMDVVRTVIERVNGSIWLESKVGVGTRIRLSLPLSIAVTSVMTVVAGGQKFGVPIDTVVETVRIAQQSLRVIKQGLVTVWRGRVIPIKSLNQLLGNATPPRLNEHHENAVLLVRVGEEVLGLLVDDFLETTDIILKPLEGVLGNLGAYAGSALMGDGSVLMVINVKEMV